MSGKIPKMDTYATRTISLKIPSRILLIRFDWIKPSTLSSAIAGNIKNIPIPIIRENIMVPTSARFEIVLSEGSSVSDARRED